jgi:tetratricopeptide (TPR) repeat protein
MRRPYARGSLDAAERALASVAAYPLQAEAAALELLSERGLEPEAASVAERTVGLVARETGRLKAARTRLRRAIVIAESSGLKTRAVEARLSLVLVLLQGGYPEAALAELDRAGENAPREARGQVFLQRALVHIRMGRFDEALDDSRRALPALRRVGDRLNEARLYSNRGILHAYRNELGLAEGDLNKALELYRGLDGEIAAAQVLHNLGYVFALKGDVPAALRRYDEAARRFADQGVGAPTLHIDRAEVLLAARLLPEARQQIELGVAALEGNGTALDLAEARLLLSQVAVAQKDLDVAGASARAARLQLVRQGRSRLAALARFVESQSRWAGGTLPERVASEASLLAGVLEEKGWRLPALECRLLGARAALQARDPGAAAVLLAGIDKRARSGPSSERARAWYAEALGRLVAGNRAGALSALRAGLTVAEDHRATLGATELRVRTATEASELAELGLSLVFRSKNALAVLAWSERWRAGALRSPRAIPPSDEKLASLLAVLRDTVGRLERAVPGDEEAKLLGRQKMLEGEICQHSRATDGDFARAPRFPAPFELRKALGERVLVEYVESAGDLYAVIGNRDRFRLRYLASASAAEAGRLSAQFALGRLARGRGTKPSLDAAATLLQRACAQLARVLIEPLARDIEGRDLIIVPTGSLHALAWALLPGLSDRTMTVCPSASLWYSRQVRTAPPCPLAPGEVVLVAGPGVSNANEELNLIRQACYPRAKLLRGRSATAKAVMNALEGRRLAHMAAHGTFRADNPQFSALELADGPLTVYDLERMSRPAQWMVLSACDAGRSAVHPGDELMGTTAALLAVGTRAIVSAVAPVPEDGVSGVMVKLHRELARGKGLAAALACAQALALPPPLGYRDLASSEPDAREALAAAALVCFGAG